MEKYNIFSLTEKIGNATVCVEKYEFKISDSESVPGYDLCLYNYFFDIETQTKTSTDITIVYFKRTYQAGTQWENPSEWKMHTTIAKVQPSTITKPIPLENLSEKGVKFITDTLESHIKSLYEYVDGSESRNISKRLVALNVLGDAGMFIVTNLLGDADSRLENQIKDAGTRNSKTLIDPEGEKIKSINDKIDVAQKTFPDYKYKKIDPNAFNTPQIISTVLSKMAIPTNGLTVKNIELDDAFRISFT